MSRTGASATPPPARHKPEQFQQKWEPVLRPELRLNKEIEQFQQKWEPVLRPELRLNKEIEHFR
jgi:hypothetical protein